MRDVFEDISEEVKEGLEDGCEREISRRVDLRCVWTTQSTPSSVTEVAGRGSGVDGDATEKSIELEVVGDNWSVNIFDLGYEAKS
jgi:hypothetical protein